MELNDILKTAHIHIETSTYRVHVSDSSLVDIRMMNQDENRPDFVNGVSYSSDPARNKTSILIETCGEIDLNELADWINSYL